MISQYQDHEYRDANRYGFAVFVPIFLLQLRCYGNNQKVTEKTTTIHVYCVYCSWVWRWRPIKHADRLVISSLTNRGCASLRTGHCMPPWIPYFSFATAMGVAFQQINLEFTSWNKPTNDGKSNRTKCLHFGNVILASCWWILILTLIGCCAIRDVMNLQRS